jgi:hypothetical protein
MKNLLLGAAAAALSLGAALAASAPASAAGDCAAGYCGRTVSTDLTPGQALADGPNHRVISTSNEQTGASLYDVKPTSTPCPAGFGNVYKTFNWDKAGDAGASDLFMTVVNGTQVYDQPASAAPVAAREFCYNPNDGAWQARINGLEIKFQFNNTPVTLTFTGTATQFVGVSH